MFRGKSMDAVQRELVTLRDQVKAADAAVVELLETLAEHKTQLQGNLLVLWLVVNAMPDKQLTITQAEFDALSEKRPKLSTTHDSEKGLWTFAVVPDDESDTTETAEGAKV